MSYKHFYILFAYKQNCLSRIQWKSFSAIFPHVSMCVPVKLVTFCWRAKDFGISCISKGKRFELHVLINYNWGKCMNERKPFTSKGTICKKKRCFKNKLCQWTVCTVTEKCVLGNKAGTHLRDGVNHVESHFHTAVGMVSFGLGQTRYTVITVPQDLYPPAVVLLLVAHTREGDRKRKIRSIVFPSKEWWLVIILFYYLSMYSWFLIKH